MPRPPDEHRKRQLLEAVVETFARDGIGNRSLRDVARAAKTSHRMLVHHFGSKEEMLLAVVEEIESRQMAALGDLPADPGDAMATMWTGLRAPDLRPFERLFFECYIRGAQGERPFRRLLPKAVHGWLEAVEQEASAKVDRTFARLGLAVTRGLLLDLVATNELEEIDAAVALFVDMVKKNASG